jgi:hypothetical protein
MRLLVSSLILALLTTVAFSQERKLTGYSLAQIGNISANQPGIASFSNIDRSPEGSPFLYDDWMTGRILLNGHDDYSEDIPIMVDLLNHHLYIMIGGKITPIPTKYFEAFQISGNALTETFEVHDMQKEYRITPPGSNFYRVLHRGRYLLLQEHSKYIRREKEIENLGLIRRPDEFKSLKSYILVADGSISRIKKKAEIFRECFAGPRKANKKGCQ